MLVSAEQREALAEIIAELAERASTGPKTMELPFAPASKSKQ